MMKFPIMPLYKQIHCIDNRKGIRVFLYCRVAHNGSGLTLDHAALKEVNQVVKDGKVDVVLVKSVSRITRNRWQLQEYIDLLTSHGVSLYNVQEQLLFRGEV